MSRVAKQIGVMVVALCGAATAYADNYTINFLDSASSSVIDATGSFTYNAAAPKGDQFSNFDVNWSGNTFNFSSAANTAPTGGYGCSASSFFAYLTTTACSSQTGSWYAQTFLLTPEFIFAPSYNPVSVSNVGSIAFDLPQFGTFSVKDTTVGAPEIDPASTAAGLTLLIGGLMVLRGRKRQYRSA